MNKKDLINVVSEKTGKTKKETGIVVDATFEAIFEAVLKKEKLSIPNLGIFATKERKGRTGRNPMTGESLQIPDKIVPTFKFSSVVKKALEE